MQAKVNSAFQWVLGCLVLASLVTSLLVLNSLFLLPSASDIASKINVVVPASENVDLSNLTLKVEDIQSTLNEDDDFKDSCKDLATAEWEERDFKDIFNALDDLFSDIDDRDDIDNVLIKDEEVTSFDVDDEDCTVVQELKVYYEDDSGDNVKVYLTVTTEIDEGEVSDQTIIETL